MGGKGKGVKQRKTANITLKNRRRYISTEREEGQKSEDLMESEGVRGEVRKGRGRKKGELSDKSEWFLPSRHQNPKPFVRKKLQKRLLFSEGERKGQ